MNLRLVVRAWLTVTPLLVPLLAPLLAADPAPAIREARDQAIQELNATRTAIAAERVALVARWQAVLTEAKDLREQVAAAERERAIAADALTAARRQATDQESADRALTDRLATALQVAPGTRAAFAQLPVEARIAVLATALEGKLNGLAARFARRSGSEPVSDRSGRTVIVPVLRLGAAQAMALGDTPETRGALAAMGDGGWRITGLDPGPLTSGTLWLDPDGQGALRQPPVRRTIAQWLAAGRLFVWPIIAVFAVAIGLVLTRSFALVRLAAPPARLVEVARALEQDPGRGVALVAAGLTPLDRVLRAGAAARGRTAAAREALVEQALTVESGHLRSGLATVLVLAGICPLLGLLGTVTGMIDMFAVIAEHGGGARGVSGGISEALVTTQAGMLAAIPLLLAHALLARAVEQREQVLEEAAYGVLGWAADEKPDHV